MILLFYNYCIYICTILSWFYVVLYFKNTFFQIVYIIIHFFFLFYIFRHSFSIIHFLLVRIFSIIAVSLPIYEKHDSSVPYRSAIPKYLQAILQIFWRPVQQISAETDSASAALQYEVRESPHNGYLPVSSYFPTS